MREFALIGQVEFGHHPERREARNLPGGLGEIEIAVGAARDETRDRRVGQKESGYWRPGLQATDCVRLGHDYPDSSLAGGNDIKRGAVNRQHHLGDYPLRANLADPAGRQLGEIDIAVTANRNTVGMTMRHRQREFAYPGAAAIMPQPDSTNPVARVLSEPQAAVGGRGDPGSLAAQRQRKLLEPVLAR